MASLLDEDLMNVTDETILFDSVVFYLKRFNKVSNGDSLVLEGYYREPASKEDVYIFISKPGPGSPGSSKTRKILYVPKRYWEKKNYKGKYGYKTHGPYQKDYDYLNANYTRVCRSEKKPEITAREIIPREGWSWEYRYAKKSDKIGVTLNYIKEMSWVC